MHARLRSLSRSLLDAFADARHPRFAVSMVCLTGFLAGSLSTAAALMPQYALIVACLTPFAVVSLFLAVREWRRRGSSGGRGDGGEPRDGPRSPAPDRWRCPWYELLWTGDLPVEPSPLVVRTRPLSGR